MPRSDLRDQEIGEFLSSVGVELFVTVTGDQGESLSAGDDANKRAEIAGLSPVGKKSRPAVPGSVDPGHRMTSAAGQHRLPKPCLIQTMVGAQLELDVPRRAGLLQDKQRFVQHRGRQRRMQNHSATSY